MPSPTAAPGVFGIGGEEIAGGIVLGGGPHATDHLIRLHGVTVLVDGIDRPPDFHQMAQLAGMRDFHEGHLPSIRFRTFLL